MSNSNQPEVQNEARDFRRFIEESFPVKEVGEASAKEKNTRQGHISTLHIWWARRPLVASRATAYAALTPAPKDAEEWQKKRDFIVQLSQWDNSNNQSLLERARREILEANGGVPPKVLDPFSGGGSYPLEALRLGCESYANDYNPVAVLIEKATLEFPQKFGRPFEGMPDWAKPQTAGTKGLGGKKKSKKKVEKQPALFEPTTDSEPTDFNPLLNAVRYWSEWILEEVRKELEMFYPSDTDGSKPVGYIWAHTIPCQNPACAQHIPLMRQFWLAIKNNKKISVFLRVEKGKIETSIIGDTHDKWPESFDPEKGTVARAVVVCPICGTTIDNKTTRRIFREGGTSQKMMAVVLATDGKVGKKYRLPTSNDIKIFEKAKIKLGTKRQELSAQWGLDPVPDEVLPVMSGVFNAPIYGMDTWGKLFNPRQALSLVTFADAVRRAHTEMCNESSNIEFNRAVTTYLGIMVDRLASSNNSLSRWQPAGEKIADVFGRQALPMLWDYVEPNQLHGKSRSWNELFKDIENNIINLSQISKSSPSIKSTNSSATRLSYPDEYFDAILTDPPYYNSVPYADLSDFFYVWLKRTIGHLYPELFIAPLTPKAEEITEMAGWDSVRYPNKDKSFFEDNLLLAFREMQRILKPNGVAVIVYAHKSTEGWETVINALLDSGLTVTGAWPLNTEMQSRLRASESAALASSIYIVTRKMPRQPTGFYNDVRTELNQHLDAKLHRLWEEGIGGADFFIAAIGSAIEVFGKYEQVMDYEGNIVRADRLLEEVRSIATNYAVKQILHNGFAAEITPMARFYVLWRWNYGEALVPFDEANKLAHSCGLDLSLQFSKNGFIKKEKDFVRMLGPQWRKLDDLDDPRDMIDVMHKALLLWEKGQRSEMVKALADRGFGKSEAFYRVAQAISETLPLESKEKKLLDGFLAGRDRVQEEVEKAESQGRLL